MLSAKKGAGHEIALGPGDLRQVVDDVEGVGGGMAGQAAQQRDETHLGPRDPRQMLHHLRQGPAMAQADQLGLASVQHPGEVVGPGRRQAAERQSVFIHIGNDGAELQAPAGCDRILERDAFGRRALDEDPDQPGGDGIGDKAVDLDAGDPEATGDLLLRVASDIGKPGGPGRHAPIAVLQWPLPPMCLSSLAVPC